MRRIIYIVVALLSAMVAPSVSYSQTNADVMANMKRVIMSDKGYHAGFSLSAADSEGRILAESDGTVTVMGSSFRMESDRLVVVCDGKTKWMYDSDSNELLIVNNDPSVKNVMENPFSVFGDISGEYDYRPSSKVKKDKSGNYVIELVPDDSRYPYRNISIYASSGYAPVKVVYFSKDGGCITVNVEKGRIPSVEEADFTFDASACPDIYITDLR